MDLARASEEAAGATVQDVHTPELARAAGLTSNPGFDLLSVYPDGRRRAIEVKGRAGTGDVEVSSTSGLPRATSATGTGSTPFTGTPPPAPRPVPVQDPFSNLLARAKGSMLVRPRGCSRLSR